MNKTLLNNLKQQLEQERDKIQKDLSGISNQNPDSSSKSWDVKKQEFSTGGPLDLESETDEVEEFINRLPIETQLETKLAAINKALERIKKGSYGACTQCEKSIPVARLQAMPETESCMKCQK